MVSCARATRGLRRPSLDARSGKPNRPPSRREGLQARNEHLIVLPRRAQLRIDQATLWRERQARLEGMVGVARPPFLLAETARSERREGHPRWSCAPGTRALRRASFDGRTSTNMGVHPREEKQARLEATFRRMTGIRCAQWETKQAVLQERRPASSEGEGRDSWYGLCACRAPTMKRWSLDARNGDHTSRLAECG